MNILTFDIEEWYLEKVYYGNRESQYLNYDYYLRSILDILDETNQKATFFCVGKLATMYPEVVKLIAEKGHEIGCHSNVHLWLTRFDRQQLKEDTHSAVVALDDLVGKKVTSYRAPAFSICPENKWAFEVLAECGIEFDASIYPSKRDFGGFPSFDVDKPCLVKVGDVVLKEFPVSMVNILGRSMAYSGGGYFRLFPYWFVKKQIQNSEYSIVYFHIADLMPLADNKLQSKENFEQQFGIEGSTINRMMRHFKESVGRNSAFERMSRLIRECNFVNLVDAAKGVDWNSARVVEL